MAGGLVLSWLEGRSPLVGLHARVVLAGGLVLLWLEGKLPLLGSLGRIIAPLLAQRDALPRAIFQPKNARKIRTYEHESVKNYVIVQKISPVSESN